MFRTTANSVPSERAFSAMKAIHSPTRNKLTPERVNKLLFVYFNTRVLDREPMKEDDAEELHSDVSEDDFQYTMQPFVAIGPSEARNEAERADAEDSQDRWPEIAQSGNSIQRSRMILERFVN